jgi:putative sigma-54 modulation protein
MTAELIQITGISYTVDESTRKYAIKKVQHLFKYLPRHAKKSVSVEVKLEEVNHEHGNKYQAEMIFNVPGKLINAKDSTGNILAAIDIVEAKIQIQLTEYKRTSIPHIGRRGIMGRFKHDAKREL